MTRIKTVGSVLVAVFAMSSVLSATASAAKPEFVFGGVKKGFESKATGAVSLETTGGTKVKCLGGSGKGEIEGGNGSKKLTKVIVKFTGCESTGFKCKTPTGATGEIITNELVGQLGYVEGTTKVGLEMKPKTGTQFAEFECVGGIVKVKITGAVIGQLTPLNTKVKTTQHYTLAYRQTAGVQEWKELVGGEEDTLLTSVNGGGNEGSAIASSNEVKGEEESEVSA